MVAHNGLDFTAALFFAGLLNVITGMVFKIPLAVQPMKAIAAVALIQGLSAAQIAAAGFCVSLLVLLVTLTGLLGRVQRLLPQSVIRGLQLGLGLSLMGKGVQMVVGSGGWFAVDGYGLALVAVFMTFRFDSSRRYPVALFLFLIGCWVAALSYPSSLAPGFHFPQFRPLNWSDFESSFWTAALPQLPLTLLNSVIAVSALSYDLFPGQGASPRRIAISVGLMNLIPPFFGAMPMCHGAGGLAGQVRFGARSNGSVLMLGVLKMGIALFFGGSLLALCQAYPVSILGVMLLVSGLELALVAYQTFDRRNTAALLVTAGTGLALQSPALGLLFGCLFWCLQDFHSPRET